MLKMFLCVIRHFCLLKTINNLDSKYTRKTWFCLVVYKHKSNNNKKKKWVNLR